MAFCNWLKPYYVEGPHYHNPSWHKTAIDQAGLKLTESGAFASGVLVLKAWATTPRIFLSRQRHWNLVHLAALHHQWISGSASYVFPPTCSASQAAPCSISSKAVPPQSLSASLQPSFSLDALRQGLAALSLP